MLTTLVMLFFLMCLICIPLYKYHVNLLRQRTLTANLPQFPCLPLLGNALKILGNSERLFTVFLEAMRMSYEKEGRFRMWIGSQFVILTSNPEDIKIVTNKFIEKPYFYNFGKIWIGEGLVTAPGDVWKRNIKKLSGTFTRSVVDGYQQVFNEHGRKLISKLKGEVGKPPFDALRKYFAHGSLETICRTALGVTCIPDSITTEEYYNAFNTTLELLLKRGTNFLYHPEFIYRMTPDYQKLKKSVGVLQKLSRLVIEMKHKERRLNMSTKPYLTAEQGKDTQIITFLELLLNMSESDPELSDDNIQAEVDTIILGGQETVSTSLQFIILLIGQHSNVQDKIYEEIKSIFGNSNRPVEKEDLVKMTYTEAVINESLRLYPPIPMVMRYVDVDCPLNGYTIPNGSAVGVSLWGSGRWKELWGEDADTFIPERWLNDDVPISVNAFIPFSYGRRSCIGRKYAISLLKTTLTWCVRELEFKSDMTKLRIKVDIAIRAIQGNLVEVSLRNKRI